MNASLQLIEYLLITPIVALFLASIMPVFLKVLRGNKERDVNATVFWGLIGCVAAGGLALTWSGVGRLVFHKALIFDGLSSLSALIVAALTASALFFAKDNQSTKGRLFSEHVFLMMNAAIGMCVVAWANDLIVLFIGIEYMSLCLYILIAMSNEQKLSKEASFKYFILGSFASAVMLFGISFLYGTVGSTYLHEIVSVAPELMAKNRLFMFGVGMLLVGLAFKVAVFPFHAWVPDVYQGAPTPVTAYMATAVKLVSFVALLRIILSQVLISERSQALVSLLEWFTVFTMLAGNIAAIMQSNVKRLLAYSGIAHTGYAMIGIIASGVVTDSLVGPSSVIFYLISYSVMTLGAFGVVALFERSENTLLQVDDLKGFAFRQPWLALCFSVFMLSLAGIPPLVGFFGKFFIFSSALREGFFWLAIWGVISSVISVYYYLRPIVVMYMEAEQQRAQLISGGFPTWSIISVSAFLTVVCGLAASPLYDYVTTSVATLF